VALADAGLPGRRLILELTESMLIADPDTATATLGRLKHLGVRVALDDFGTGYSSLSYLERFPVDILKIDKSFTDTLSESGNRTPMLAAIVGLGRQLGLEIVAEGVETADQAVRLAALDCRLAQGYHFARPCSSVDVAARVFGAANRAEVSAELVV
jgi:EAL domain-containing protein (putative c-di-GMP-specific phosphodiesterase class I)